jgi:phosphoketolase
MTATLSTTTELTGPLPQDLLRRIDAYWRAANYLSSALYL